jgi:phosphoenolpyruvate synthase/pyruvate phosphate dikinase
MAVLVQEIIQADYAFVIHTTNPSTEDETEIYAEVKLKAFVKNGRSTLNIVY